MPELIRLLRSKAVLLPGVKVTLIQEKPGRTEYQRAIVSPDAQGQLCVQTTGDQGSGVLSSMVRANGLLVLHHDQGNVAPGDVVDVMVFAGVM